MLFGLGDAAFNTQLYAVIGALQPDHGDTAFAVYQLCQQVGNIMGFALPLALPLETSDWPILVQVLVLVPATLLFCTIRVSAAEPAMHQHQGAA
jgi:hypothetical protein